MWQTFDLNKYQKQMEKKNREKYFPTNFPIFPNSSSMVVTGSIQLILAWSSSWYEPGKFVIKTVIGQWEGFLLIFHFYSLYQEPTMQSSN